ncbi:MAG: phosphatidate cytidylyltransferase, partial [Planctomycetota bacterium]
MLRSRLITGPILAIVLLAIVVVDNWLDGVQLEGFWNDFFAGKSHPPRGLVLFGLTLAIAPLAARELSNIFRANGIATRTWLTTLATMTGLVLSYSIPTRIEDPLGIVVSQGTGATTTIAIISTGMILIFVLALLTFSRHRNVAGVVAAAGAVVFAMVYLGFMLGFLLALRRSHSAWIVVGVVVATKSCDTGAYFTGRAVGRHKLIPWLSPGKTWEGLVGQPSPGRGRPRAAVPGGRVRRGLRPRRPAGRPCREPLQTWSRDQGLIDDPARARRRPRRAGFAADGGPRGLLDPHSGPRQPFRRTGTLDAGARPCVHLPGDEPEPRMSLTENLVNLFQIDAQVRGLRRRLDSAERYLAIQTRYVEDLEVQRRELEARHLQLQAKIGNLEGEMAALDERLEKLRNELNAATTNKQYSAVLTELNTAKNARSELEDQVLAEMELVEENTQQRETLKQEIAEREKVKALAAQQLQQRHDEVGQRLAELEADRE